MQSSYWRINYGPEAFEEETECVATILDKALKRTKRQGYVIDAAVFILRSKDPNPDDWEDVKALVKYDDVTTALNLRAIITAAFPKHASLFATDCQYDALNQAEYELLMVEYQSKRL